MYYIHIFNSYNTAVSKLRRSIQYSVPIIISNRLLYHIITTADMYAKHTGSANLPRLKGISVSYTHLTLPTTAIV